MRFVSSLAGEVTERPRIGLIQGSGAVETVVRELEPTWGDRVHFIMSISSYGKPILTLTAMGAHKGKALAVACEDLGIGLDEVVAFGDSGNDVEMFKVAGASVAMGQADDDLKSAATYVSAPNDQDGVAVAVERLLKNWRRCTSDRDVTTSPGRCPRGRTSARTRQRTPSHQRLTQR